MKSSRRRPKKASKRVLDQYYYNVKKSSAYAGAPTVYRALRKDGYDVTHAQLRDYLRRQNVYVKFQRVVSKFPRRPIVGAYLRPGVLTAFDLVDVTRVHADNEGYKWILVLIGGFNAS